MDNGQQVSLFNLVFTHNWEDPESDHRALQIRDNESVFAITSGGCNVLGFLLFNPRIIYSIDINPMQSYILELKIAAIKGLTFHEFVEFSGLRACTDRMNYYQAIKNNLSPDAAAYWDSNKEFIARGFIMSGKYERFIRFAGKFISLLQGRRRVSGLFDRKDGHTQEEYFDEVWNTKRFQWIFKILFNKQVLARRGLVADYFHFDDGSRSFAESFYNRSRKALRDIPIEGNYFLSLYLLGRYRNEWETPPYLQPQNYDTIKERIDRIRVITADAQSWIQDVPPGSIDCFALSNICELMSEAETHRLFSGVLRAASDNARVSFRNLIIPREVPDDLASHIVKDDELSKSIYFNDRSFVYGKVAAYRVRKGN
ncbi:MAG: BtaA family protein [Cyclobacteriaceae bacterium]|nr:BtaA family protein [Cyclobacteriaceae bacterium]